MNVFAIFEYTIVSTLFISLMAQLSFNLPKSVSTVPITMQTFAINVIPLVFGAKIALFGSITYYCGIGMGLPIGAGGEGGVSKLYGPTGGYLVGFILASFQMGIMIENDLEMTLLALVLGNIIILVSGMIWLPFGLSFNTAVW
eukprot:297865_1